MGIDLEPELLKIDTVLSFYLSKTKTLDSYNLASILVLGFIPTKTCLLYILFAIITPFVFLSLNLSFLL